MKHLTTFENDKRVSTQGLLQQIYEALAQGETEFVIEASGQHNIGGPLWVKSGKKLKFTVRNPGQRLGSMGLPNTEIIVEGAASADVGWLNAGATIVVKGDGGDTSGHCAADGVIYIGGRAGTRTGSLMKCDPSYAPPQLWILKNTGSFPFEFMGGGIAIVCGHDCPGITSIIGDRPCVGMVGGTVYIRGPVSTLPNNVKLVESLSDEDWGFLADGIPRFLNAIQQPTLRSPLSVRGEWRKIVAKSFDELKSGKKKASVASFHASSWIEGGIFGDVVNDPGVISPLVPIGDHRVLSPVWNNAVFAAPCEYACPSGIPTQERVNLLRKGKIREALELVLQYSPFPGSVCGTTCPNPCMSACTRQAIDFAVLAGPLGKCSIDQPAPICAPTTEKKFAVIGSGASGLSAAWQLALRGHQVTVFEKEKTLGGKIASAIPNERLDKKMVTSEIQRILGIGIKVETGFSLSVERFQTIRDSFDGVVLAIGAQKPRLLTFPGGEKTVSALDFLVSANAAKPMIDVRGKSLAVIGSGDVGMDVCCVSWKLGAKSVTALDIQEPASSSRERNAALALGTKLLWPRITRGYSEGRLHFENGDPIEPDVVVVSIGETPVLLELPDSLQRVKNHWLSADESGRTSDPKVYAIGDVVRPGLLTEAIGAGRRAALALHAQANGETFKIEKKPQIPSDLLHLQYFTPQSRCPTNPLAESDRCISCGTCRDCNICIHICGQNAISRHEHPNGTYEYRADQNRCIGCGFCAAACPCGIWTMVPNLLDQKSGE